MEEVPLQREYNLRATIQLIQWLVEEVPLLVETRLAATRQVVQQLVLWEEVPHLAWHNFTAVVWTKLDGKEFDMEACCNFGSPIKVEWDGKGSRLCGWIWFVFTHEVEAGC